MQNNEVTLTIDPLRLEDEWVRHPQMVLNVGLRIADLQHEADEAKYQLDAVTADLDKEIRDEPASYGISKLTETIVYNTIVAQPEYKAAVKKKLDAEHDLQKEKAISNALEHKKRALSMLVELWLREYYSDPKPRPMSANGVEFDKHAVRSRGRRREEEQREEADDS